MLGFLAGLPGKLKTLTDRLSATWAAKLDTVAGLVTPTWAAKLDTLASNCTSTISGRIDAAISSRAPNTSPTLAPPVTSGLVQPSAVQGVGNTPISCGIASTTNSTAFVDVVNYTGAGVLEFAAHTSWDSGRTYQPEIIIDGATVYSPTITGAGAGATHCPVGTVSASRYWNGGAVAYADPVCSLGSVSFNTSLQVRHKVSSAGGSAVNFQTNVKYRKTA